MRRSKSLKGSGNPQFGKRWMSSLSEEKNISVRAEEIDAFLIRGWKIGRRLNWTKYSCECGKISFTQICSDCQDKKSELWQNREPSLKTQLGRLKLRLIEKRGYHCEECEIEEWNDKCIALELHHEDGDKTHNDEDNLKLLCPNCHSQTDTWRRRKDGVIPVSPPKRDTVIGIM